MKHTSLLAICLLVTQSEAVSADDSVGRFVFLIVRRPTHQSHDRSQCTASRMG